MGKLLLNVVVKRATLKSDTPCNPYCKVFLNGLNKPAPQQTAEYKRTLEPVWFQDFKFKFSKTPALTIPLCFDVCDAQSQALLGRGSLELWKIVLNPGQEWELDLQTSEQENAIPGTIVLHIVMSGVSPQHISQARKSLMGGTTTTKKKKTETSIAKGGVVSMYKHILVGFLDDGVSK